MSGDQGTVPVHHRHAYLGQPRKRLTSYRSFTRSFVLICVAWTTAAPLLAHLPHSGYVTGLQKCRCPTAGDDAEVSMIPSAKPGLSENSLTRFQFTHCQDRF